MGYQAAQLITYMSDYYRVKTVPGKLEQAPLSPPRLYPVHWQPLINSEYIFLDIFFFV